MGVWLLHILRDLQWHEELAPKDETIYAPDVPPVDADMNVADESAA